MGRKFGGRWKSGGRREERRQKTLTCLKCTKPFPLSEFAEHVRECKGNLNDENPSTLENKKIGTNNHEK